MCIVLQEYEETNYKKKLKPSFYQPLYHNPPFIATNIYK